MQKKPIKVPAEVTVQKQNESLHIKGKKGEFTFSIHHAVDVNIEDKLISVTLKDDYVGYKSMLGTTVVILNNMITGVHAGFEKKLQLVGVGYRAKAQGDKLDLNLGFSHPVQYVVPKGITVETPSNTEIILKGIDKEKDRTSCCRN